MKYKKRQQVCCKCEQEVGTEYLLINDKVYHQSCFWSVKLPHSLVDVLK